MSNALARHIKQSLATGIRLPYFGIPGNYKLTPSPSSANLLDIIPQVAIPRATSFWSSTPWAIVYSWTASPTICIIPVPVPPVIIQAPVLVAAWHRPCFRISFSRGFILNRLAPPVTEMSSFGIGRCQYLVRIFHTLSRSVTLSSRTY